MSGVNKKLSAIETVVHEILNLLKGLKNNKHPTGTQRNTEVENLLTAPQPSIIAEIEPTPIKTDSANKCHYQSTPKWKTRLEVAALIFGIGYAIVTGLLWWDQHENFKIDERAWVGPLKPQEAILRDYTAYGIDSVPTGHIPPVEYFVYIKEDQPIRLPVVIINSGKTPAINVQTIVTYDILNAKTPFKPNYAGRESDGNLTMFPQATTIMMPKVVYAPTFKAIQAITRGTDILYLYGKITYTDTFNKAHETDFCVTLDATRQVFTSSKSCDPYNSAN